MALKLVPQTHPVLREIAREVTDLGSKRLKQLAEEMDEVRIDAGGIGLAAPQVGLSERIIIVEVPDDDFVGMPYTPAVPPTVLVNPEIVWESGEEVKLPEACLSLPGFMGNVIRPSSIIVEACDVDGGRLTIHADRWFARVLQHEVDHLDGILFPDRIEDASELWRVERVDLADPIWAYNTGVQEIREELMSDKAQGVGMV